MADPCGPDSARLHRSAEKALVVAAQGGAGPSRDRLVETFLPRIAHTAHSLSGASSTTDLGELARQGVAGLLRGLERYDPALGTPFWGYASWWVRHAMRPPVAESVHGPTAGCDAAGAMSAPRALNGTPAAGCRPRAMDRLSDDERRVLRGRYGLDGRVLTVPELSRAFGMSSERVRQVEHAALATLGRHAA